MAMTLYQKSYAKSLAAGATKTTYINSVYDTYSHAASSTSKWRTKKTVEKNNVHACTRKLTVLNDGTPA